MKYRSDAVSHFEFMNKSYDKISGCAIRSDIFKHHRGVLFMGRFAYYIDNHRIGCVRCEDSFFRKKKGLQFYDFDDLDMHDVTGDQIRSLHNSPRKGTAFYGSENIRQYFTEYKNNTMIVDRLHLINALSGCIKTDKDIIIIGGDGIYVGRKKEEAYRCDVKHKVAYSDKSRVSAYCIYLMDILESGITGKLAYFRWTKGKNLVIHDTNGNKFAIASVKYELV